MAACPSPFRLPPLVPLLLCLLAAPAARAGGSVSVDVTAGRGSLAWALLGDVELVPDRTFLLVGYTAARMQGAALLHQLSAGVDHGVSMHWRLSALLDAGLPAASVTPLPPTLRLADVRLRSESTRGGLTLRAAWDSAGLSDLEWGFDAGLSASVSRLQRSLLARERPALGGRRFQAGPVEESLVQLRPSAGLLLVLWLDTELSLRGSHALSSRDPLTVGQLTAAQLDAAFAEETGRARDTTLRLRERNRIELVRAELAGASAAEGLLTAPILFDTRLALSHRFGSRLRGQLSYAFTRYVPSQGATHVLGTRWSLRLAEGWRAWAGVSLQRDLFEDGGPPDTAGLLTLGGEYSF